MLKFKQILMKIEKGCCLWNLACMYVRVLNAIRVQRDWVVFCELKTSSIILRMLVNGKEYSAQFIQWWRIVIEHIHCHPL